MTKEELEKEAYKEAEKLKEYQTEPNNEYEKGFNNGEVRGYKDGYRDGAKSREKHIADLEKENAELSMKRKAEIKIFQGIVEKKNDQLTNAKEIIKKLVEAIHIWDCKNLEQVEAEAEQFLNSDKPREEKEERKYYCKTCRDLMCPCSGTERYEINCSGVEED